MKECLKKNKLPVILTFVQCYLSTVLDIESKFFAFDYITKYYLIIKLLYPVLLFVVWKYVFFVYREVKKGNPIYKRGLQIFCAYFSLMVLLLLVLWPGTWSWDDLWTLSALYEFLSFCPWQHTITGIYQDLMLQILPFPGGFILLQNMIIALCVSFSVVKLENTFSIGKLKNTFLDIFLKIVPFLLPPVLMHQFSGYRMGLYVYLELAVLVMLICAKSEDREWTWEYLLLFGCLLAIAAVWRTEAFLYVPCACILILSLDKAILPRAKKVCCILVMIVGFLGMTAFQNAELGEDNYEIVSLMRPCTELVRAADSAEDAAELAVMDKVVDLQVIYDNPSVNGEALYWDYGSVRNKNDNHKDDSTPEDYKQFKKAFVKLAMKYPEVVITERLQLFLIGAGIKGKPFHNVDMAAALFQSGNGNEAAEKIAAKGWIAYAPLSEAIRSKAIILLGGADSSILQRVIWNGLLPILILAGTWIVLLWKKKWYLWAVCSSLLAKLPLVILTEPSSWFMYYLSFYLLGNVLLVYGLWILFSKEKATSR